MRSPWQLCRMALALLIAVISLLPSVTNAQQFEAGSTRILSYNVNMTIANRFATTHTTVEVINQRNCSTLKGFTSQLPLNARVTKLEMTSTPSGCEMNGVVKAQEQAEQEFQQSAAQGRPAALLQAYDTTNYGVQLSLPPQGRTVLEIRTEELLVRKRGQVDILVPIYPGLPVDSLTFALSIKEYNGVTGLGFVTQYEDVNFPGNELFVSADSAYLELTDVAGSDNGLPPLPRLLRGYYDPGPLPENGLIIPSPYVGCFVHLFNPASVLASAGSLPRNIVFVIDVSGSMSGQKLEDAKAAFAAIIQLMTGADFFTIHSFSNDGVERSFGPVQGKDQGKQEGQNFVYGLQANGSTNLERAYVEGILQVKRMQDGTEGYIPIVMVLTDGQATAGLTSPTDISRSVQAVNYGGAVKVYGLAFGADADFNLLTGISLQNGGYAVRIYEGYGDAATQMENFYVGELGTILMSDLQVTLDAMMLIDSQTQTQFPIFAEGSEVAVRARFLAEVDTDNDGTFDIRATTTANTTQGTNTWQTSFADWSDVNLLPDEECSQSFAHAKISELMLFRDAALSLGSELLPYYDLYSLQNGQSAASNVQRTGGGVRRLDDVDLVSRAEADALQLALDAGVVWPGLTAMVTVENDSCNITDEEVCYDGDGDSNGGQQYGDEEGESDHAASQSMAMAQPGPGGPSQTYAPTNAATYPAVGSTPPPGSSSSDGADASAPSDWVGAPPGSGGSGGADAAAPGDGSSAGSPGSGAADASTPSDAGNYTYTSRSDMSSDFFSNGHRGAISYDASADEDYYDSGSFGGASASYSSCGSIGKALLLLLASSFVMMVQRI